MGIFSSKPKISNYDWWKQYLESNIKDIDPWNTYTKLIYNSLDEKDKTVYSQFSNELEKIRIEIVLMMYQHLNNIDKGIHFHKGLVQYLEMKELMHTWNEILPYNQFISDIVAKYVQEKIGVSKLNSINQQKVNSFDNYLNRGEDPKIVARELNRLNSEKVQKEFLFNALTNYFIHHAGIDKCNFLKIYAVLNGFYNGAKESLQKVSIT